MGRVQREKITPQKSGRPNSQIRWWTLLIFLLALTLHSLFYLQFFPNANGNVGHDYAGNFPALLAGYFWYLKNGLFSVPWFSPAFMGGGALMYGQIGDAFFSLNQWLVFVFDPLVATRLLFFATQLAVGGGSYLLGRHIFRWGQLSALIMSLLALYNSYFALHMVIGHTIAFNYALLPLHAYLILAGVHTSWRTHWPLWLSTTLGAAMLFAYQVFGGGGQILPYYGLSGLVILCLALLARPEIRIPWLLAKIGVVVGVSSLLTISKLSAAATFMAHFARTQYTLPGFNSLSELLGLTVQILFFTPPAHYPVAGLVNSSVLLQKHEFEYSSSFAAFFLLLGGTLYLLATRPLSQQIQSFSQWVRSWRTRLILAALVFVLLIPLALNFYTPSWNTLLKQLPIIQSLSHCLRFFTIYIFAIVVLCGWIFEKMELSSFAKRMILISLIVGLLAQNFLRDLSFYEQQLYNPQTIIESYHATKSAADVPAIKENIAHGIYVPEPAYSQINDGLTRGHSQLRAYYPLYGYRLESFPFGPIQIGAITNRIGGFYNFKNPACLIFPQENRCELGGHFRLDQRADLDAFASYQSFPFEMPARQHRANRISLWSWILCTLALAGIALFAGISRLKR